MNHAGMTTPSASLRWPVSISWLINTLTSVESPTRLARIFIGSAMSSSASAKRHFDFLGRDVVFAVGFYQRDDVRALPHLDPGQDGAKLEHRRAGKSRRQILRRGQGSQSDAWRMRRMTWQTR